MKLLIWSILLVLLLVTGLVLVGTRHRAHTHAVNSRARADSYPDEADLQVENRPGDARSAERGTPAIPESPPDAAPIQSTGTIRGRLLDQDAIATTGTIKLQHEGRIVRTRRTDNSGEFSFALLSPGDYMLLVDEKSLNEGFLPPWRQDTSVPGTPKTPGLFSRIVRVPADGGSFDVDLTVFRSASVRGFLLGADGEPVEDAWLVLDGSTASVPSPFHARARTGNAGAFEITEVYPARYRVSVDLAPDHRLARAPRPLPSEIDAIAGSSHDVIVRFERGSCAIDGIVADSSGAAVEGVDVVAYYGSRPNDPAALTGRLSDVVARTMTNADGRFELTDLPTARIHVLVGAQASSNDGINGTKLLKRWAEPRIFDLTSPGEKHSDKWTVERSALFTVRIRVQVDSTWAASHDFRSSRVRVSAQTDSLKRAIDVTSEASGAFVWKCEMPCSPVTFRIFDRKGTFEPKAEVVYPERSGLVELDIAIP